MLKWTAIAMFGFSLLGGLLAIVKVEIINKLLTNKIYQDIDILIEQYAYFGAFLAIGPGLIISSYIIDKNKQKLSIDLLKIPKVQGCLLSFLMWTLVLLLTIFAAWLTKHVLT